MIPSVRAVIEDFLSYRRIALAGVSRSGTDFSRTLFRELQARGYDVVPVNPGVEEIEGKPCFPRVSAIQPPVDGVLVMTPGAVAEDVVKDCAAAGVGRVWLYKAVGGGAVTGEVLRLCEEHGIAVVPGECPFMYLAGAGWIHGVHRFCRKMVGTYPE
jgi:predicted CoA-binding protein